jgi:hypothetical protein
MSRNIIFSEKKDPCEKTISCKGVHEIIQIAKVAFQFTFDHFQPFLREIQGQFGLQLIRGIPNSKNAWRIHDDDDGDDDGDDDDDDDGGDDDDNLQYNDDHLPSF